MIPCPRTLEEDALRILACPLPWNSLDGRTVLVSGAAGMLPAYAVEVLLHRNDTGSQATRVIGLVRNLKAAQRRFAHHLHRPELILVEHDVSAPLPSLPPFDIVIHGASPASPTQFAADPIGTLAANTIGTWHLLSAAERVGASAFLYLSSGAVYGRLREEDFPVREEVFGPLDPLAPDACYGEGKRAGEALCAAWHRQRGLRTFIARIAHTYGPGIRPEDGRAFADFLFCMLEGRDIVLSGNPEVRRAFCYAADATEAFFTILFRGTPGVAYNVGNPDAEMSIAELAQRLAGLEPGRVLKVCRERADLPSLASPVTRGAPCIDRLRDLGWSPRTSIEEGFLRTLEFLRATIPGVPHGTI